MTKSLEEIEHKGTRGVFIDNSMWTAIREAAADKDNEISELKSEIGKLRIEVDKARGEQKYKLKKLSQIIERKDRQISALRDYPKGD